MAQAARVKRGDAGYRGKPAVILSVQKQPGADTVALTGQIESALAAMQKTLPAGMELVDLSAGEVDVAIRYGSGRYPGLEVRRLLNETVIPVISPELLKDQALDRPEDLKNHVLLHDGSPDLDDSCPDWSMWLAARGLRGAISIAPA